MIVVYLQFTLLNLTFVDTLYVLVKALGYLSSATQGHFNSRSQSKIAIVRYSYLYPEHNKLVYMQVNLSLLSEMLVRRYGCPARIIDPYRDSSSFRRV